MACQATPVLEGGTLFGCTPGSRVFALDAETGAERWRFALPDLAATFYTATCRGVALWRGGAEGAACGRRVLTGTRDRRRLPSRCLRPAEHERTHRHGQRPRLRRRGDGRCTAPLGTRQGDWLLAFALPAPRR